MYLVFISSIGKNVELAKNIVNHLNSVKIEYEVINLVELNITLYNSYKETHDGIPPKINELAQKMEKAKGYIFVSPEYNYSIPPVQTNVIAWLSRIGDNFRKLFALKYIQLATHSGSGGQDVCHDMRTQFTKLGSIVMPREIITTYQKDIKEESLKHILDQYLVISGK